MEQQISITQLGPDDLRNLIRKTLTEVLDKQAPAKSETCYKTARETCDLLHITKPTLNKYVKYGFIKERRMGRRILYQESDIQAAVKEIPNLRYNREVRRLK